MVIWHSSIFPEAVAIGLSSRLNVPERLEKINFKRYRNTGSSGYTHLTAIAHRVAAELDTYVWERIIGSNLKF